MSVKQETVYSNEPSVPVVEIRPARGWMALNLAEIWEYRELLYFLTWRDIKVKYKQTFLGFAWAILVPFMQMVVFATLGGLAGIETNGLPKMVFYFANMTMWNYFATALNMSAGSLVSSSNMLTKIYFPRLIVPTGPCLASIVDFLIAFAMLVIIMLFFYIVPPVSIVLVPLLLLMAFGTALGVGLIFAALNVKYRDIRYVMPPLIQIWMFGSVLLPFARIHDKLFPKIGNWTYLYGANPMGGVIEGFRWCLFHTHMTVERVVDGKIVQMASDPPWGLLAVGIPVICMLVVFGLYYFRRVERMFADIV